MSRLEELIPQLCPDGVEYKHLGDICAIKGRIGFRGYTRNDQVEEGEGALSLSPTNIQDGRMDYTKGTYITWEKYEESPEIMTYNGDIIFCKTASVGKTALVKDLPYKATINPQLVVLKDIQCNTPFLAYVLETNTIQKKVVSLAGVGSVPNISQKSLSELEIPLPPLPVQEEIVRLLDQLTETTQKYQAELASELELRKKQYEEYRNRLFDLEGKEGVEIRTIGSITKVFSASRVHKNEWTKNGVPFWRSSDLMSFFNGIENPKGKAYISHELYEKLSAKSGKICKDDILVTGGGSIGIPYIVPNNNPLYVKDADLLCIVHNKCFKSKYLYYYMLSTRFRNYLSDITHNAVIAHYTISQINTTPIPLPSLSEQERIVNILDRMDKTHKELCKSIEDEIKMRKQQYEYYRNQLLDFKKKED